MSTPDLWTFRESVVADQLVGYDVEALDGGIGEVDEATDELGASFIAVKTGPWIFGRKVILPAAVIQQVDHDAAKVYVMRTKDEIKNAPEFDDTQSDDVYRADLGRYYGPGGAGYREPR
jgi:hypothetical protein